MSEVFISYKQEERERMRPIAASLRALEVDVWFDERLAPDKAFTEEIESVAANCGAQLVCWSPAAVKSEWVRGEAEVGRQRGTLVQAMIEPCVLSPPFNVIHAEDISDWSGQPEHAGWQKLLKTVGRKIGRPGLAELALIQGSPVSEDWKRWASKYPADPLAETAWQRAEALHLDAERGRMKKEWQATRKRAEEAEARRRAAEEARRRSAQARAAAPAINYENYAPPRRRPVALIAALVLAAGVGAGVVLWPRLAAQVDENALAPEVTNFARELAGTWRIEGGANCDAPYVLQINDDQLSLIGPDGSEQRETINGLHQGWLRTHNSNQTPSFYQRRGRMIAYRYADIEDRDGETRFERCAPSEGGRNNEDAAPPVSAETVDPNPTEAPSSQPVAATVRTEIDFDEIPLSSRPHPLLRTPPAYPQSFVRRGGEAVCLVNFDLEPSGAITNIRPRCPQRDLADAMTRAIRQWVYQPYQFQGRAVKVRDVEVEFVFQLAE